MKRDAHFLARGFLRTALAFSAVLAPGRATGAVTPISPERAPHLDSAHMGLRSPSPKERARMGSAPLSLADKPVVCRLVPTPAEKDERPPTVPEVVKALAPGRKLFLVVKDLRTNRQPGVLYSLYLDLPEGASPEQAEAHFVGAVNFFNAKVVEDPTKAARSEHFVSFDVTQIVKTLSSGNQLKENTTLTVAPDGMPASGSKPLIGEISLVEQD